MTKLLIPCTVTLKNYRPFSDESPAVFTLGAKFVAIVGPNNAGKSALLRFFYEFRPIFLELSTVNGLGNALRSKGFSARPQVVDPQEVFHTHNDRRLQVEIEDPARYESGSLPTSISRVVLTLRRNGSAEVEAFDARGTVESVPPIIYGTEVSGDSKLLPASQEFVTRFERIRAIFEMLSDTIYAGPFRNAITVTADKPYFDLSVGTAFITEFDAWKSGAVGEYRLRVRRIIEMIRDAFGLKDLGVSTSSSNETFLVDLDGGSYTLSELGAGLAQFIILVSHAVFKQPALFLVDEPELNLHPALQTKLVTILGVAASGVVFSTHSIGLARSVSEQTFVVQRQGFRSAVSLLQGNPRLLEFAGEMSYSGRGEVGLGVSAILLVEGPTDVPVFQHFLSLYHREHQVLVLPLGGEGGIRARSREQLIELQRVTPLVYAVIDSERRTADAPLGVSRQRFLDDCSALGIKAVATRLRATENYFPSRAVREVYGTSFRGLAGFERLKDLAHPWDKGDNYEIAHRVDVEHLNATDLGPFLSTLDAFAARPNLVLEAEETNDRT